MADLAELTLRIKSEGVKQARDEMGRFVKTSKEAETQTGRTTRRVREQSKAARDLGKSFGGAIGGLRGLVSGFTALAVVRDSVRTISDFNNAMAQVEGIAVDTTASLADQERQYRALEEAARRAGATTRFSAGQAAEAELALARAGLNAEQVVGALESTLNLAAGASIDLGSATSIAASAMNQFQLEAGEVSKIADVLTISANSADTTVLELGQALSFVGGVAKGFGLDLETTSAFLSTFAKAGITATRAGTSLRAILSRLAKPTSDARRALKAFGLTTEDIDFNNLPEFFEKLRVASQDLSKQDLATNALRLFGQIAAPAGLAAIQFAGNLDVLREKFPALSGEAQRQADILNGTLRGSFLALRSSIEELQLQIGDGGLLGGLQTLVDFLTDTARALGGVEAEVLTNTTAVRIFTSLIQGLGVALGVMVALKVAVFFTGVATSIVVASRSLAAFTALVAANPFGALIVAITAVVAAFQFYKDEVITIGDETASVGDFVGGVFDHLVGRVEFFAGVVTTLLPKAYDFFRDASQSVFQFVGDRFNDLTGLIGGDWGHIWDGIVSVARRGVNIVVAIVASLAETVKLAFGTLRDSVFAVAQFDFRDPIESAKRVRAQLGRVLDPAGLAKEVGRIFTTNFETDFVGQTLTLVGLLSARTKQILGDNLTEELAEGLRKNFTIDGILDDIRSNVARRRQEREAGLGSGPEGGENTQAEVQALNKALDELGLLLEAQGKGGQVAAAGIAATGDAAVKAREDLEKMIASIRDERALVGLSNDEREKAILLRDAERIAATDLTGASADLVKQLDSEIDALQKARREAEANGQGVEAALEKLFSKERFVELGEAAGEPFGDFFANILTDIESTEEALENLAQSVIRLFTEELVASPVRTIFSGLGTSLFGNLFESAKGNVFQGGQVVPFASGGIISGPTFFPLNNGTGLAGEAGPEAIFPLTRDSKGDLALKGTGSNAAPSDNRTIINRNSFIFPNAKNPAEFRQARRQVAEDLNRVTNR